MTYDPRDPRMDPVNTTPDPALDRSGSGWGGMGILAAIVVIALIIGGLFWNRSGDHTASNTTATRTSEAPASSTASPTSSASTPAPAPAPAPSAPAPATGGASR